MILTPCSTCSENAANYPPAHGPQCACRDCLVAHCAMERALSDHLADILRDFVSGLADMTTEEFRTGNDYILRRAGEAALAKFDAARART